MAEAFGKRTLLPRDIRRTILGSALRRYLQTGMARLACGGVRAQEAEGVCVWTDKGHLERTAIGRALSTTDRQGKGHTYTRRWAGHVAGDKRNEIGQWRQIDVVGGGPWLAPMSHPRRLRAASTCEEPGAGLAQKLLAQNC